MIPMVGRPVRSLCNGLGLMAFSLHLPETPAFVLLASPFLVLPMEMHILLKCQSKLCKKSHGCERFPHMKSAGREGSLAIIGGGGRIRDILGF